MKNNYSAEKILIVISLVLFSGIIFYNAFFIPEVTTPAVIYVDKDDSVNDEIENISGSSGENANDDVIDISDSGSASGSENSSNSSDSNNTAKSASSAATTDNSEENESSENSSSTKKSSTMNGKVNINTATEDELAENVPGVGASIAKRIVEYRNYNGDFFSIEEIKNVSGIGDKKFEAMKDMICV